MAWTSPRTWVAGETVTAALMNVHVRDNLKAIGDPWVPYTPALRNWTLDNGTLSGAYIEVGKLVHFRLAYTVGSTDTISGNLEFTLPTAGSAASHSRAPLGRATMQDVSAASFRGRAAVRDNTDSVLLMDESGTIANATVPWTWAAGDTVEIYGTYQAP